MLSEGNLNTSHCYQLDVGPSSRYAELGEGSQVSGRAPEGQHKETPVSNSVAAGPQLQCLCVNAYSMGKHKITESHNERGWKATVEII